MIQKLRAYINRSFENVPKTKKSIEMQEELIANLIEKYRASFCELEQTFMITYSTGKRALYMAKQL